jgi:hypothetical protein
MHFNAQLAYDAYDVRYCHVCSRSINALCNNQFSPITVAASSVWNRSQDEILVSNTANWMSVYPHMVEAL